MPRRKLDDTEMIEAALRLMTNPSPYNASIRSWAIHKTAGQFARQRNCSAKTLRERLHAALPQDAGQLRQRAEEVARKCSRNHAAVRIFRAAAPSTVGTMIVPPRAFDMKEIISAIGIAFQDINEALHLVQENWHIVHENLHLTQKGLAALLSAFAPQDGVPAKDQPIGRRTDGSFPRRLPGNGDVSSTLAGKREAFIAARRETPVAAE